MKFFLNISQKKKTKKFLKKKVKKESPFGILKNLKF